jgi:hypothetical protein
MVVKQQPRVQIWLFPSPEQTLPIPRWVAAWDGMAPWADLWGAAEVQNTYRPHPPARKAETKLYSSYHPIESFPLEDVWQDLRMAKLVSIKWTFLLANNALLVFLIWYCGHHLVICRIISALVKINLLKLLLIKNPCKIVWEAHKRTTDLRRAPKAHSCNSKFKTTLCGSFLRRKLHIYIYVYLHISPLLQNQKRLEQQNTKFLLKTGRFHHVHRQWKVVRSSSTW